MRVKIGYVFMKPQKRDELFPRALQDGIDAATDKSDKTTIKIVAGRRAKQTNNRLI